ncbi:phage tail tip lysozyme [Paraburkholderia sp. GAS32]|uniref:phage tail tip lysozyme n=1 Tax=Paraburkholderia sp. GAS32 TaxID=3035129 RepID=UPI003D21AB04
MVDQVKIGVGANVSGVDAAIQKITASMNKLGAAVAKNQGLKFEPTDMKLMARDLSLINTQMKQVISLSPQLRNALKATGQSGAHLSQIDFSKLSTNPATAQRMRDRAFMAAVRGSSLDPTLANDVDANGNAVAPGAGGGGAGGSAGGSGGAGGGGSGGGRRPRRAAGGGYGGSGGDEEGTGSWWKRRPNGGWGTATALAVGNGIGGTAGNMITAGLGGGGLPGMAMSLLTSGIGKGAQFVSEGVGLSNSRAMDLDTLKRSMGDLGVSFDALTAGTEKFNQGLGVSSVEFAKLENQANQASGGMYRTPDEVAAATRQGADLGRAYGIDPSQGVGFMSGMQRLNSRQNNKELATQLAEAIVTAQGKAAPGEVMQAMQSFAASQNRFNAVNPNLSMFGNAYGSMLTGDMTADHASSILGTANSAMQRMGGTEATRNFLTQQFGMDPIRAQLRAEGGLFSNGLDNQDVAGFMSRRGIKNWNEQYSGPAGSNLAVTMQGLDKAYSGRGQYGYEMELDAVKNMFGLKSLGDAASLANASTSDHNGIATILKNAGVGLSDLREGGLQAIAGISKAGSFDDLEKLYRSGPDSIRNRKDMSPDDLAAMDSAEKSGNFQQLQNELVRVLAGKGQEDTQGSLARQAAADLNDIKTNIGTYVAPGITRMESWVEGIAKKMLGIGGDMGPPAPSKTATGFDSSVGDPSATMPGIGANARPGAAGTGGIGKSGTATAAALKAQLIAAGVPEAQADGMLGNAMRESSLDPSASNAGHYGLLQWDAGRQKDFAKWAGHDIHKSTAAEQMAFALSEISKGGSQYGKAGRFWAAQNAGTAGVMFGQDIERPGDYSHENPIRYDLSNQMAKIPAADLAKAKGGSDHLPGQAPMVIVQLEQNNSTTVNGSTKTKKLSTTINPPTSSGMTQRVSLPGNSVSN